MTQITDIVLSLDHVNKEYKVFSSPKERFKSLFSLKANFVTHHSLKNISFDMMRAECVGVIGNNGAGKSTLLKLIAGTIHPTSGHIHRKGRITAILELGAGFHPDFTGLENLYFSGSLIGISQAQMKVLEQSVIDFSELGEAIYRPVKTYSSGMVVRLAFSLVTAVEPDILIVDEALAVGDHNFQKKCMDRISSFQNNGCSILFCSHSLYHVRQLCNKAIWLDNGRICAAGATEEVIQAYETYLRIEHEQQEDAAACDSVTTPLKHMERHGLAGKLLSLAVLNLHDGNPPKLGTKDLSISVSALSFDATPPSIAIMLEQAQGVGITSVATHIDHVAPKRTGENLWQITLTFPDFSLHSGNYVVSAYLFDSTGLIEYDKWYQHLTFSWTYPSALPGLVRLPHAWF